jgi:DNA-binding transcriptional LysR family regulator
MPTTREAVELSGRTLVAFPHGCSYRQRLVGWLAESGMSPDRVLEMSSYHAIVACVAAGTRVAIVPAQVRDHALLSTAVQRHPLPPRLRVNRTHLVWLGKSSAPLQALTELVATQLEMQLTLSCDHNALVKPSNSPLASTQN